MALALEATRLAARSHADVIIVVSADTDLDGIPHAARQVSSPGHEPRVEVAVVRPAQRPTFN